MQTRKRAKTITFGKPDKPKEHELSAPKKEEKIEEVSAAEVKESQEAKSSEPTHAAKKVLESTPEPVEAVEEKEEVEELSTPEVPAEKETENVLTPPDQFLSDTPGPASPEAVVPKEDKSAAPMVVEPLSSTPTDPSVPTIPDEKPAEPAFSPELSPTPPSSAFTIQENSNVVAPTGEAQKKNFVLYFIIVAFISFALGLGAMAAVSYFGLIPTKIPQLKLNTNVLNKINPNQPTPTSLPTAVPTATPTAKALDLKAFTIQVLNGSGIVGKAADVKTSLTTAGFKVTATGNADRSDYTTTQIAAKKSVDAAYLDKLQTELKKSYSLEPVSTIPSDSAQVADVIVTLGKTAAK